MDNEEFQRLVLEQFAKSSDQFAEFGERLGTVEKNQLRLEMRMENEIINSIKALLDGYKTHEERLDRIEDKVDDVSTDVRYLVARVTRLEKLAK